jgi:hypothetical protein
VNLCRPKTAAHCNTENSKQIFPEKELRCYNPNSYIPCFCERFIYSPDRSAYSAAEK